MAIVTKAQFVERIGGLKRALADTARAIAAEDGSDEELDLMARRSADWEYELRVLRQARADGNVAEIDFWPLRPTADGRRPIACLTRIDGSTDTVHYDEDTEVRRRTLFDAPAR
jgi:hypothetical protein